MYYRFNNVIILFRRLCIVKLKNSYLHIMETLKYCKKNKTNEFVLPALIYTYLKVKQYT